MAGFLDSAQAEANTVPSLDIPPPPLQVSNFTAFQQIQDKNYFKLFISFVMYQIKSHESTNTAKTSVK
jgi:hypothetical protein